MIGGFSIFKKFYSIYLLTILFFSLILKPNNNSSVCFPIQTNYVISSYYGKRSLFGSTFHHGIDIAVIQGTKVYAMASGVVTRACFTKTGGYTIYIDYYNGYTSIYCHLNDTFFVSVGDKVNSGTLVALVGPKYFPNGIRNGNTTGPHLHFGLYKNKSSLDPLSISYTK